MAFTLPFFRALEDGDPVSKQTRPKTSESGRGRAKLWARKHLPHVCPLLYVFLLSPFWEWRGRIYERLPGSAHQSEYGTRFVPWWVQHTGIPQREEQFQESCCYSYIGVVDLGTPKEQVYKGVVFPTECFLSLIISFEWCVYIWRLSMSDKWADGVKGHPPDWERAGGCLAPVMPLSPQVPHPRVFPCVTVRTVRIPLSVSFQGNWVAAAFSLSWPANPISWSFWKQYPQGSPWLFWHLRWEIFAM